MTARNALPFLVPEVVQPSANDCGPAVLTAALRGFGIEVDEPALRDRCLTDVDGTSVTVIAGLATELGLAADEVVVPVDQVLLDEAHCLPAIAVTLLPDGLTHFVLLWRQVGGFVEVMDPAVGRRWVRSSALLRDLYVHSVEVPADAWREYAGSEDHLQILRCRLERLGVADADATKVIALAERDPTWRGLGRLDAAIRAVRSVGGCASELLAVMSGGSGDDPDIADHHWSVRPCAAPAALDGHPSPAATATLVLRGAVLVKLGGRPVPAPVVPAGGRWWKRSRLVGPTPLADLRALVGDVHPRWPAALVVLAGCWGASIVGEAVALRAAVDHGRRALGAAIVWAAFSAALGIAAQALGRASGQVIDARLRQRISERFARVADRYVSTRAASDLAERAHSLHRASEAPARIAIAIGATAQVGAALVATALVAPATATAAVFAMAMVLVALAAVAQPATVERELRARSIVGALGQALTDVVAGADVWHAHRAGPTLTARHEAALGAWRQADRSRHRLAATVAASLRLLGMVGVVLGAALAARAGARASTVMLVGFLAFLVAAGVEAGTGALRALSAGLVTSRRLLEPLRAPVEPPASLQIGPGAAGLDVDLRGVGVEVAGRQILERIDLDIPAGTHVAVVGRSGSGKSTLLALVLGLIEPDEGEVRIDGRPLGDVRTSVRRTTAWIDGETALWAGSMRDAVSYGNAHDPEDDCLRLARVAEDAALADLVVVRGGWDTEIGRGGRLLSSGEGQRIRVARALDRRDVRLVIADEPLRGLEVELRRSVHAACRRRWADATVLWATHDMEEAARFDLVVVMEDGHVVEVGAPTALGPDSRFASLRREAEELCVPRLRAEGWRHLHVDRSTVRDDARAEARSTAPAEFGAGALAAETRAAHRDWGMAVLAGSGARATVGGSSSLDPAQSPGSTVPPAHPCGPDADRRISTGRGDEGAAPTSAPDVSSNGVDATPARPRPAGGGGAARLLLSAAVTGAVAVLLAGLTLGIVGRIALDRGATVGGWLVVTAVGAVALGGHLWLAGRAATTAGQGLRRRLLPTLAVEADELAAHEHPVGLVLELGAIDRATVAAALLVVEGCVDVILALAVLVTFGPGLALAGGLVTATGLVIGSGVAATRHAAALARLRVDLSATTTDTLLEHRTRLIQSAEDEPRHDDREGRRQIARARLRLDRTLVSASAVLPALWQVGALVAVAEGWVSLPASDGGTAAVLGAVVLAGVGLQLMGTGTESAAEGGIALARLRARVRRRPDRSAAVLRTDRVLPPVASARTAPAVEVRADGFTADAAGAACPVFERLHVRIEVGDRVIVTGPSGAGKSTLVRTLGGAPTAREVDRTVGHHDGRPLRVVAVPPFHRNHVFAGSLAFNVLLGRGWPGDPDDEIVAEEICRSLGLGPLIDRMPAGMGQQVGETGWRLSHGERSRIYVARALAQDPDVLLVDEALAALDVATARRCLDQITARCPTVVLVSHD